MTPDKVRSIAEREKELFADCPYCVALRPLWDHFREQLHRVMHDVGLVKPDPMHDSYTRIDSDSCQLHCTRCGDSGRVLTELGQALAAALELEKRPALKVKGDEIPF